MPTLSSLVALEAVSSCLHHHGCDNDKMWALGHYPCQKCGSVLDAQNTLTHWGRVTHICVSKLTVIASDNGLSPGRRQAIIWNNDGILLIWPLGTNFSEILIEIHSFSFRKMRLKVSSAKWWPFCLGLNVLNTLRPEHNGCYSADDKFELKFMREGHMEFLVWKVIENCHRSCMFSYNTEHFFHWPTGPM